MKLVYQKPTIEIHHVEMETHLLNYSTTTGDPTGGEGDSYPNPFGATPAKKNMWGSSENEEDAAW